ncbi:recombination repair protein 1-like [Uranotaenia lowii]|uniref:recombination repair protein 1-like n=1 Tax=Uranotaenia lowii TaxID=190385 RepID=UPI00247AFA45|nr:recombination repair protein 1-like [Uranotaenia lowii]
MAVKKRSVLHKLRKFILRKILRKSKKPFPIDEEIVAYPEAYEHQHVETFISSHQVSTYRWNEKPSQPYNLHLISLKLDNLTRCIEKGALDVMLQERPNIVCIQESTNSVDKTPGEVRRLPGYHPYWLHSEKHQKVATIYSRTMPMNVLYGFEVPNLDDLIITAEFEKFFLICALPPNSDIRLKELSWEDRLRNHALSLDFRKPVIICGNFTTAHHGTDKKRCLSRTSGTTCENSYAMTKLLSSGFIDTSRVFYPEQSVRSNESNRFDHIFVSTRLRNKVVEFPVVEESVCRNFCCPGIGFFNL